jgi:hypothetical protein
LIKSFALYIARLSYRPFRGYDLGLMPRTPLRCDWASSDTSRTRVAGHAGLVAGYEVIVAGYAGPWTVGIIGLDGRVPLVGLPHLSGDLQTAVDIADFEDFVLENDLLAIPRA